MSLSIVIAPAKPDEMHATIREQFPDDHYRISQDTWVVFSKGMTTQQLSDRLLITLEERKRGPNANGVVFKAQGSYWGRFNTGLWEWLKVKLEGSNA